MRHSPVHKGERVTHVEQRVNYIIINKFRQSRVRRAVFSTSHYIHPAPPPPPLHQPLCAQVEYGARLHSSSSSTRALGCIRNLAAALPFTYFDAYCNMWSEREVQRESERQIHNNNNNIMLFLRGARALCLAEKRARSSSRVAGVWVYTQPANRNKTIKRGEDCCKKDVPAVMSASRLAGINKKYSSDGPEGAKSYLVCAWFGTDNNTLLF